MWGTIILYTLGSAIVTAWLYRYWNKQGKGSEKWVSVGWMLVAWITGVLFMAGLSFPVPTEPLFPGWLG